MAGRSECGQLVIALRAVRRAVEAPFPLILSNLACCAADLERCRGIKALVEQKAAHLLQVVV
jgi:hypothetical protein